MVGLASYHAIKEAFVTRGNDFASRPQMPVCAPDDFQDDNVQKTYYFTLVYVGHRSLYRSCIIKVMSVAHMWTNL